MSYQPQTRAKRRRKIVSHSAISSIRKHVRFQVTQNICILLSIGFTATNKCNPRNTKENKYFGVQCTFIVLHFRNQDTSIQSELLIPLLVLVKLIKERIKVNLNNPVCLIQISLNRYILLSTLLSKVLNRKIIKLIQPYFMEHE